MDLPEELKKLLASLSEAVSGAEADFDLARRAYIGTTRKQQEKLSEMVSGATHGDTGDLVGGIIIECLANLTKDKWWEPLRVPNLKSAEAKSMYLHMWEAGTQCKEIYIDLALQLRGDAPAASITWHGLLEDSRYYWTLDIRNAVRQWMVDVKLIATSDPLA